jgi:hypothetical protein
MARTRNRRLWLAFIAGNVCMLVLHSTILQPIYYWNDLSSQEEQPTDCHGLEGTKVLLLDVHLEGNLGDEMETMPLLQELRRCGIHTTAILSGWLEGFDQQLGFRSIREHGMVDSLQSPGNYERFLLSEYHAVILAPGPWRLCQLRQRWPKRIDIWMAGSILPEQQQQDGCDEGDDVSKQLDNFDPTLMILRETYSYNLIVQNLSSPSWKRRMNYYLSGDLTHSFVPASAPLDYWKRIYSNSRYKDKILVFSRSSNAANVISIKGRTVELVTLHDERTVVLRAKDVVFATSSALEDATMFVDWKHQYYDRFQEHQFVVCETVEQLFGLIYHSKHLYTDRYHPGVVAHRFGKEFTVLKYEQEQSKLVGLAELVSSKVSAQTIKNDWNAQAFAKLREALRIMRKKRVVY